ncbi:MAG: undecaprenyl-diphosphate phosphatase, partial [Candidatus Hodarchaeota archaeon]
AEQLVTLVVWLHLGTILAVIARYPRTILEIITLRDRQLFRLLLLATAATAVTAIPLYFLLKDSLMVIHGETINILVGALLFVTAMFLWLPTRNAGGQEIETTDVDNQKSLITGIIQGFSVLPGLSRSGITISVLLMQKIDKEKALQFSFLMSVPAVLGILALEILTGEAIPPAINAVDLFIMEVIVFVIGLISMEFLLRIARRISFWKLCVILGIIAIAFGIPALL